jgi:MFS family permease
VNLRFALTLLFGFTTHVSTYLARTASPLLALKLGEGPVTVGLLLSVFSLIPIFLAIPTGRWVDRVGGRAPILLSSAMQAAGLLLPAAWPGIPALAVSALLVGSAHMLTMLAVNHLAGALGDARTRGSVFVWLTMGFSAGTTSGPLIAGFALDLGGNRAPFAIGGCLALLVGIALAMLRGRLPDTRGEAPASPGSVLELVRDRLLRRVLIVSIVGPLGWDLFYVFIPLHGTSIGLSASNVGTVLSLFAIALFLVRLAAPALQRALGPWPLISACYAGAGLALCVFPFTSGVASLAAAAFCFGLFMGLAGPLQLYLSYEATPEGRKGEVSGLRQTLFNVTTTVAPTLVAALSTLVGFGPVIWATGAIMMAGGRFAASTGRLWKRIGPATQEDRP